MPRSSAGPSPPWAWRAGLADAAAVFAIFCGLLVWTGTARIPFWSIEGSDDAFFLEVARLWTRGVLPYAGAFDIKPPGYLAILAVAEMLFGAGLGTLKTVTIGFDAVAATALYCLGRRMGSRAIGAFAALLYPLLSQFVTNNPPYAPLGAFTTLAFLAALSPLPILRRAALAGLAIGAAVTIKQTAGFEAVALLAVVVRAPDARSRRIRAAAAFGLAAGAAPAAFLLYFAAHGDAGVLIGDVVVDALNRPASAIEHVTFLEGVLRSVIYLARPVAPICLLAGLAVARREAIAGAAPRAAIGGLGLWVLATILSIWVQRALFQAYLGPALAPLALLAGAGLAFGLPEIRGIAVPLRLALVGLATFAIAAALRPAGFGAPLETRAFAIAAEAIRASEPAPDDRLFVVSRGMELYVATDLAPPTAYFHWEHTLCDFPGAGPDRLAEALAAAPRYLVVADRRRSTCELPRSWPEIDAALARSYRLLAHVDGDHDFYDVYEAVVPLRQASAASSRALAPAPSRGRE